jgi:hypothetical protein
LKRGAEQVAPADGESFAAGVAFGGNMGDFEFGLSKVAAILTEPDSSQLISRLGLVEAVSAFALKVREGQIQIADFAIYRKRLLGDVRRRKLSVIRVRVPHFMPSKLDFSGQLPVNCPVDNGNEAAMKENYEARGIVSS